MRPVRLPQRRLALISRLIVVTGLAALTTGPLSAITGPLQANVQISQIYAGGGNTGAPYTHDFVELHNPRATSVNVTGWTLQYGAAIGNTWTSFNLPSLTIAAGGYALIQLASGGANGVSLPAVDVTGPVINMAAGAGKVVLVASVNPVIGECPADVTIQDMVGYGATANCYEGAGPTPAPSNSTAVKRLVDSCGDTNVNSADFSAVAPAPRNFATAPSTCEATMNETDNDLEVDYCILQFPASFSVAAGTTTATVYSRIFQDLMTSSGGAHPSIAAQIGYGTVDPATQTGFTWFNAAFNTQIGNDDEYQAAFTAPGPGSYVYTARFSLDGVNWTYCDLDGAGANPALTYSNLQLGVMTVTAAPGAPGPPTGVIGTGGNQLVNLSWSAPADPGLSDITGYQAQVGTSAVGPFADVAGCTVNTNTTNCVATGLTNGTTYFFRVNSRNDSGFGDFSTVSSGIKAGALAGTPTDVTGTGANQQVNVSWTAPADLGLPALTGFHVQKATGAAGPYSDATGCASNSTIPSCTATGLTNGVLYYFKVASINAVGTGSFSTASGPIMPGTLAGTPTGVVGARGNTTVDLLWFAPADLGSPALTGYRVQVATSANGSYSNAAGCPTNSTSTTCTVTGLTNGIQYFFKVAGIGGFGTGPYSTASSGVTPATVPGQPTGVTATAGSTTATVSFVAPLNGGDPITSYAVIASSGNKSAAGPASPVLITGLTNGTPYTFTVVAENGLGFSAASSPSNQVTPSRTQFTDTVAASGPIRMVHVLELRNSINETRQAFGLLAVVFTDSPLVAGSTPVKAAHITELRQALNDVYVARAMTPPTYTDPALTTSTTIKAVHINQIRAAIIAVQ